jgi:hypothetical protein
MALLNTQGTAVPQPQQASAVPIPDTAATETKREKKNAAAKRFKERRTAEAQAKFENALKLRDELVRSSLMDKLTAEAKSFVLSLCKDPAERAVTTGLSGPSVFVTLFGVAAKVGDKILLEDIFKKTGKGKSTMDVWLKRWLEKGIKVEFTLVKDDITKSIYTIVELPAAA